MKQQKVCGPVTLKPVNGFFSYWALFKASHVDSKWQYLHLLQSLFSGRNGIVNRGSFAQNWAKMAILGPFSAKRPPIRPIFSLVVIEFHDYTLYHLESTYQALKRAP